MYVKNIIFSPFCFSLSMTSIDPPDDELPSLPPPPSVDRHKRCVLGPKGRHQIKGEKHFRVSDNFLRDIKKMKLDVEVAVGDWVCHRHASRIRAEKMVRKTCDPPECYLKEIVRADTGMLVSPKF